MQIPFVNLRRQYEPILPELHNSLTHLIDANQVVGGVAVDNFELSFSKSIGVEYTVSCANGTDALEIILRSWNIGVGDEVIVPANGWLSAALAVCLVGATPVFIDNHPQNYNLNLDLLEERVTSQTKVIIPIHLYGNPVDMEKLKNLANQLNLKILEDCAQAHGASIGEKNVGSWGQAGIFSFYPTKNLSLLGDGGAIVTNDEKLAERCRAIASYGQYHKYTSHALGKNSRMDALQAKILSLKLPMLDVCNQRRKQIAHHYHESWADLPVQLPLKNDEAVWHLFVVQVKNRDKVRAELARNGIQTEVHYPIPVCQQPVFQPFRDPRGYPIAERQAPRLLSIPLYPELTDAEVHYVVETFKKVIESAPKQHQSNH